MTTPAAAVARSCAKPAKLDLWILRASDERSFVGTYCIDHFHHARDLLTSQSLRTTVAILAGAKPIACQGAT
jgi:hypothetical protein